MKIGWATKREIELSEFVEFLRSPARAKRHTVARSLLSLASTRLRPVRPGTGPRAGHAIAGPAPPPPAGKYHGSSELKKSKKSIGCFFILPGQQRTLQRNGTSGPA